MNREPGLSRLESRLDSGSERVMRVSVGYCGLAFGRKKHELLMYFMQMTASNELFITPLFLGYGLEEQSRGIVGQVMHFDHWVDAIVFVDDVLIVEPFDGKRGIASHDSACDGQPLSGVY